MAFMKVSNFDRRAFLICAALAVLAGCNSKGGSGFPFTPLQGSLYVFNSGANTGSIVVYTAGANGNVAPLATISGSNTKLQSPLLGTVDSNGTIYAPNSRAYTVTTYTSGKSGNVSPTTTISGSNTGLGYPSGIAVDQFGKIYVGNPEHLKPYTSITVYAPGANGNVSPVAKIKGSNTNLEFPYNVALDSSGYIYAACNNGKSGSGWINVYSPGANGNVKPVRIIQGSNTGLNGPFGLAFDSSGELYVTNEYANSVTVFAAGANGNVSPVRTIAGSSTGLDGATGIAIDSSDNVYVANEATPSITIYAPNANGDVSPTQEIEGSSTGLTEPFGVAIY